MPRADRDDDDDDDRPRRRRRRARDDDPPRKSGPSVWLILAIVGGVMMLLCGGVGVYIAVAAVQVGTEREAKRQRWHNDRVKPATFATLKAGMTLTQVEDVLGPGQMVEGGEVNVAAAGAPDHQKILRRWEPSVNARCVMLWRQDPDVILVAFSADPKAGGTVIGTLSRFGPSPNERVRLGGELPDPETLPPLKMTAEELVNRREDDEVIGRWVIVTGELEKVIPDSGGGFLYVETVLHSQISCKFETADWPALTGHLKPKDRVTIKGKLTRPARFSYSTQIVRCELVAPLGK